MIRCGVVFLNEMDDDAIPCRFSAGGANSDGDGELVVALFPPPPTAISTLLKRDGVGVIDLRGRQDGLITTPVGCLSSTVVMCLRKSMDLRS